MIITSSEPINNFGISGKGFIISLGLKVKARSKICIEARNAIVNVSKKDLSKIIREFDKLSYKRYGRSRPKHEPTYSYFYLARELVKCIMIYDALNLHVYAIRTDMTAKKQIPILHVCSTTESELEEFLVEKNSITGLFFG